MMERIRHFLERTGLDRLINRETLSSGFWGVMTTVINIGLYRILLLFPYFADENRGGFAAANAIAIIVAKVAAYFVNKFFVFQKKNESTGSLLKEIFRFAYTRGLTFLLDYFGLIFLVDVLGGNKKYMKYITTVVVVIVNYLFGKFLVFRKQPAQQAQVQEEA